MDYEQIVANELKQWQRMGAEVTGVDLSDAAIEEANKLNKQLSLDANFISCNIYDLKDHLNEQFDIVFTSYGVIGWLPDLKKWAELISYFFKAWWFFLHGRISPGSLDAG